MEVRRFALSAHTDVDLHQRFPQGNILVSRRIFGSYLLCYRIVSTDPY